MNLYKKSRLLPAGMWMLTLLSAPGGPAGRQLRAAGLTMERIDAHAHVFNTAPDFVRMSERLNIRMLNVCVVDKYERGYEQVAPQHETALRLYRESRARIAWCSTFDPEDWETPGYATKVISQLEETFKNGALAVKIYKSIGMNLQSRSGAYLMPDNPVFDPIFQLVAKRNKTLYAHIAEPMGAWRPLDPSDPDYGYYKNAPAWHMYGRPGSPTKEEILAARDRMIARNPGLRVVGCHLGSMEEDVDDIAKRFDRYPNFVVDTAARILHLMLQPRDKVRAFILKYQDRILYATDLVFMGWEDTASTIKKWEAEYERDYKYFATDGEVEADGRKFRGLALPEQVLSKLYYQNAVRWVPGIAPTK